MTHILFVDDIILFGVASKENSSSLSNIPDLFQKAIVMLINHDKSCMIHNISSNPLLSDLRSSMPFPLSEWAVGFKYLGFSLKPNSYVFKDWLWLYQNIEKCILLWTNRCLSKGGQLVLLKSVLQSIDVYWATIATISKGFLHKVKKICFSFLWTAY